MDKELGSNPTLPPGLTIFLVEGMGKDWGDDAPSSSTHVPMDSLWLPPSKGSQHCPTYMGGAWLKVPTKPSIAKLQSQLRPKGGSDMVNHPSQWILVEMNRIGGHPYWWKELRASERVSMGRHIMRECLTDAEALHYVQWQAAAFRLPLTQKETSGWWDAPPWFHRLCPQDFMIHTDASGTKDFQTVRQEKTLAKLGMPNGA